MPGDVGAGTSMSGDCGGVSGGGSVGWPGWLGSGGISGGSVCTKDLLCFSQRTSPKRVAHGSILAIGRTSLGRARVAELVDALDLGSSIARCGGSSPFARTTQPCSLSRVASDHAWLTFLGSLSSDH